MRPTAVFALFFLAACDTGLPVYAGDFADDGATEGDDQLDKNGVCDASVSNDTMDNATPYQGALSDLSVGGEDLDYYAVVVPGNGDLSLDLYFEHAFGDIDVRLKNAAGDTLASSLTVTNDESLGWTNPDSAPITVYAEVESLSDTCAYYDLHISTSAGSVETCAADSFEPNENAAQAVDLGAGFSGLTLDEADSANDWFRMNVADGEEVVIGAVFAHAAGDIDLYLEDVDGNSLAASTSTSDDEMLAWRNDSGATQTVYVGAKLYGAGCTTYDLEVERLLVCADDAFEPSDSMADAAVAPSPQHDLVLDATYSPEDWYSILVGPGATLDMNLAFDHNDGDIDLHVEDDQGNPLVSSTSTADIEQVNWTNSGTAAVEVFAIANLYGGGECTKYDMEYTVTAGMCDDDAFEEDDVALDATEIHVSWPGARTYDMVANDTDWLFLDSSFLEQHNITLLDGADADLDIYLWDQNFNLVDSSATDSDIESVHVGPGKSVYIEIRTVTGSCAPYELRVDSLF